MLFYTTTARTATVPWPFAAAAFELHSHGLAVIPTGGDAGKVPLVKWASWRRPPGRAFLEKLIAKHPDANIGVLCGLSNVTIVDVDAPELVKLMLRAPSSDGPR
jgi:hypothetical protein